MAAASCCGPMTSDVGISCEAAKAASCGPKARAPESEERDSTRSEKGPLSRSYKGLPLPSYGERPSLVSPNWCRAVRSCQECTAVGL